MLQIALLTLLLQSSASLDGIIVKQGTGEPIAGATLGLNLAQTANEGMVPAPRFPADIPPERFHSTATSDKNGRFVFRNVLPGEYQLFATHPSGAYVPAEYGQRTATGEGIKFTLTAGQNMAGVVLAMTPTGSISGRVYDADGDPLGNAQVQAMRPVYKNGERTLTIVQIVQSDDRGEYRLFWLPPGQYYVSAKPDIADLPMLPGTGRMPALRITNPMRFSTYEQATAPSISKRKLKSGEVVEETTLPVYFPGTIEAQSATAIALQPGAAIGGIDFSTSMGRTLTHHVRGRVINGGTGQAPVRTTIELVPRNPSQALVMVSITQTDANGTFDLAGLIPGSYLLLGYTQTSGSGLRARAMIDVGDRDVENLAVVMTPPFSLTGRFIFDGSSRADADLNRNPLFLTLTAEPAIVGTNMPGGPGSASAPGPDGSFKVDSVAAGDYRVAMRALSPNAYVKAMRMGSNDILNDGLHLNGPPENPIEVTIGMNAGVIEGTVVNARQESVPNRTVVLVPDFRLRQRSDLYKTVASDSNGHFQIKGITPGTYKLFAFEQVESGAWQDPAFLRPVEGSGKLVQVNEGGNEPIQLTVIQ